MEKACVLHPDIKNKDTRRAPENSLAEAVSLANALRLDIGFAEVVNLRKPQVGLLFGKGKLEELHQKIKGEYPKLCV